MKFKDYKKEIVEELKDRLNKIPLQEKATLIEWFFYPHICDKYTSVISLWWPTVPMVGVVWDESGRVYFYALKALLSNLEIQ